MRRHSMSNAVAKFLLEHNVKQSEVFSSPDAAGARKLYRSQHPTEIAALKCMDGRLNLAIMTQTEPGIIQPFRNIGGKFDLGWPYFGSVLEAWVNYSLGRGRKCLVLATYHYSKGDTHRGCAGHGYDTDAAQKGAHALHDQIERVFGKNHSVVYPIVVGIETDEDTLVLTGKDGSRLDLCTQLTTGEDDLYHKVQKLYPDMDSQMVNDLMPLVRGNVRHIAKVREMRRPIEDAEHKEQVIAVGRGFDWLHLPNKALIVGPYSPNLASPIGVAGKVVSGNIKGKRIDPKEGIVLLSSAVYRDEAGFERTRAIEKAKSLAQLAFEAVRADAPEIMEYVHVIAGTVNENTRLFTQVPFEPKS